MTRLILALAALALAGTAQAAPQVSLDSELSVMRSTTDASGKATIVLEEPRLVVPGDRLRFTLSYANSSAQPATDFVVTNPIPAGVAFAGGESAGAVVSVDGGRTFGALASLTVPDSAGKPRAATPADVTHVRWTFAQPIAAGAQGRLHFEGVVR